MELENKPRWIGPRWIKPRTRGKKGLNEKEPSNKLRIRGLRTTDSRPNDSPPYKPSGKEPNRREPGVRGQLKDSRRTIDSSDSRMRDASSRRMSERCRETENVCGLIGSCSRLGELAFASIATENDSNGNAPSLNGIGSLLNGNGKRVVGVIGQKLRWTGRLRDVDVKRLGLTPSTL
jgi:hypothetical protein